MAYNEIAVADEDPVLGDVADWTVLSPARKQAALDTAQLWLEVTFIATNGQPLPDYLSTLDAVPARVKAAELVAVRHGLTAPLFAEPLAASSAGKGAVTKERVKVDVIEREFHYATPDSGGAQAVTGASEIDALLYGIAIRRGTQPALPAIFVV